MGSRVRSGGDVLRGSFFMSPMHGASSRALNSAAAAERSFGRLFPDLPPLRPAGLEEAKRFGLPGGIMDGGDTTDEQSNPEVPSGFTYFGQFIDHDITLDVMSELGRRENPSEITDFRTPRLDLDNLYGAGPVVSPHLYDPDSFQTKLALSSDGADLARTSDGIALIGDPRNDENLILAQFHLALIMFHNRVVDLLREGEITDAVGRKLPPQPEDEPDGLQPGVPLEGLLDAENYYNTVFAGAQRLVRWHYQWLVVHEFLPLFGDGDVVRDVEEHGPRFFRPSAGSLMPVEFAVAAFRFGHPTVRTSYRVNEKFAADIFPDDPEAPAEPRRDLRGGPVLPEHTVDWTFFFDFDEDDHEDRDEDRDGGRRGRGGRRGQGRRRRGGRRGGRAQLSKRVDARLSSQLLDLPVSAVPGAKEGALARPVASLAVRNLLRGETLGLPSGQDVARKLGVEPLTDEELETSGPIYLWYYILKEAEVRAGGRHLGPVGTRIVAEVLIGLLNADPTSYRSAYPRWRPTLADEDGGFTLARLLRLAGPAD